MSGLTKQLKQHGYTRHKKTPAHDILWNTKKGHKITTTTYPETTTITIQTRHHNPKTNKTTYKTTHHLTLTQNQNTWTITTTHKHNQTNQSTPPLTTQQLINLIKNLPPTPPPPKQQHYIQNLILQQTKNKLNQTPNTHTTFTKKAHKPEQPATIKIQTKYHQAQLTIQPPTTTTTTTYNPNTHTKETNQTNNPGTITLQHHTLTETHQTPTPTFDNPKYNPDNILEYAQHIQQQLQQLDHQYHQYHLQYCKTKLILKHHQNNLFFTSPPTQK